MRRPADRGGDLASALAAEPVGAFSEAVVEGLPEVVARYFRASFAPGAALAPAVRITMRGRIRIGRWLPFTAVEVLHPRRGFQWRARVAGRAFVGEDRYLDGRAALDWRLLGLVPVVRGEGPDVARSAAGRAAAESLWAPASLLPGPGLTWEASSERSATVRFTLGDTPLAIDHELDGSGRVLSTAFDRWGDPDRTGTFGWHRSGGEVHGFRSFGGVSVPARGSFGWHFGTPRWPEGEFFRYEITALEPLTPVRP